MDGHASNSSASSSACSSYADVATATETTLAMPLESHSQQGLSSRRLKENDDEQATRLLVQMQMTSDTTDAAGLVTDTGEIQVVETLPLHCTGDLESGVHDVHDDDGLVLYLICMLSAISGFLFGYDLCVMVIILPLIQHKFSLSTTRTESVVSILMFGAVFGALAAGPMADWLGRKPAIVITSVFFFLGSLSMTFAPSLELMLMGRFLTGLAVGSSGPCVSVYIAEIARPSHRGVLVTVIEVMLCFGCLVSVLVGGLFQHSPNGWRKALGMALFPPIIQLCGISWLPESPRWLAMRASNEPAVLKSLVAGSPTPHKAADEDECITPHRREVTAVMPVSLIATLRSSLERLVVDPTTRRRLALSLLVAICQTMTGASAMLYYSSYIMKALQPARKEDHLRKEILIATAKFTGVCSAICVVDRIGRRPLLLLGSAVMMSCHLVLAWSSMKIGHASSSEGDPFVEQIAVYTMYLFIYAWNFSWAPLMLVVCSELLPNELRSVGMGVTFAAFWLASACVNQTLLTLFDLLSIPLTFLFYASLTLGTLCFVLFKVPETKGLSFEQITLLFTSG